LPGKKSFVMLGAMEITILGSGTSTGVPMVGCNCSVCSSTDPKDCRSRTSILICNQGYRILVDTSTDLRMQMLHNKIDCIDAVLFTHYHADHTNGIDDLRGFHFQHNKVIPCFGDAATIKQLNSNFGYIFSRENNGTHPPLLQPNIITDSFSLFGLEITPVPLIHGAGHSCGYRIDSFAYLTDCSAIPATSKSLLADVKTVIIDGLRWKKHPYHFNIMSAIEAAHNIGASRIILTHLTHEVSYSDGHLLPEGVEFAFDGMFFTI